MKALFFIALGLVGCSKPEMTPVDPPPSNYGNEGGNGGDTLSPDNGSAWFLTPANEKDRRYLTLCFEKKPSFRAGDETVRKAISTAVDNWEVYLAFKGVSLSEAWKPTVAFMPSVSSNTYASDPKQIASHCRGDEDLQLFLGGPPSKRVEKARQRFRNPLAFAFREDFDLARGWGRGFIWIAEDRHFDPGFPLWNEASLTTIVAHELGHVLGCEHVAGTVLREDILDFLKSPTPLLNPFKINRERELLLSRESDLLRPSLSTNGESSPFKNMYDQFFGTTIRNSREDDLLFYGHLDAKTDPHSLEVLWGRPLKGDHVRLFEKVERRKLTDHYEFLITLKEGESVKQLVLDTPLTPIRTESEAKVFQMAVGQISKSERGGTSELYGGNLLAPNGKTYPVLVQRNAMEPLAALAIWFIDDNRTHPLFYPDPNEGLWTNLIE